MDSNFQSITLKSYHAWILWLILLQQQKNFRHDVTREKVMTIDFMNSS